MYSHIKSIVISNHQLFISFNDEHEDIHLKFNVRLQDLLTYGMFKVDGDEMIAIKENWLYLLDGESRIEFQLYWPHAFRSAVMKDLRADREFTLDYRKHLRKIFSKNYFRVCFIGFKFENFETDYYLSAIHQAYAKARVWSQGQESIPGKGDRPMIIITPDDLNSIFYKIVVDFKEVEMGWISNDPIDQKARIQRLNIECNGQMSEDMEIVSGDQEEVK